MELCPEATVSELIDGELGQWDRGKIARCFNPFASSQILNIPISRRLPEDKLSWQWEKDGRYSVRSAHHLLCEENFRHRPETSTVRCQGIWKKIWSVHMPKSAQNFLWRLVRNILPTRKNLSKKGILLDTCCPICNSDSEDNEHLFVHCPAARAVWFSSPLGIHVPYQVNLRDWIQHWLSNSDSTVQQIFGITLWQIWYSRNQLVFKNKAFDPIKVSSAASSFVEEFNSANVKASAGIVRTEQLLWSPPSQGVIKINVDAGIFKTGHTGFGMIARDSAGRALFVATKIQEMWVSPLMAEALCLRWCLEWAKNKSFPAVIVETDADSVAKALSGLVLLAEIDLIMADCLELLAGFENISVVSVKRQCNAVAHSLARLSNVVGTCYWEESVPTQVYHIYCKDLPLVE